MLFLQKSLCTWIKMIVSKFAISNHMALVLGVHALRIFVTLLCVYELHILSNKKIVVQRIMEKLHQGQTAPGLPSFA